MPSRNCLRVGFRFSGALHFSVTLSKKTTSARLYLAALVLFLFFPFRRHRFFLVISRFKFSGAAKQAGSSHSELHAGIFECFALGRKKKEQEKPQAPCAFYQNRVMGYRRALESLPSFLCVLVCWGFIRSGRGIGPPTMGRDTHG